MIALALIAFAADPVFWQRYFTLPLRHMVTATDWYTPKATVTGAPGSSEPDFAVAGSGASGIRPDAIARALAYAKARQTVALLVYHSGVLGLEYYAPGFSAASLTDSQSMHKSVLGLLVGIAIGEGSIHSVEDPIGRYLPEWSADPRGAIRVRELLQMSSGLAQASQSLNPFSSGVQLLLSSERLPKLLRTPLTSVPGRDFDYNPVDSELLGAVLESATHRSYADYLSERLWRPLGARDAYVWLDHAGGLAHTACCLQATARDWLRLGLLVMHRGFVGNRTVVPAAWLTAMLAPSAENPNYGYQVWLGRSFMPVRHYTSSSSFTSRQSEPFAAPDVVYFDGSGGQRVYIVPSRDLVIVRTGEATRDWDDAFLPNIIIRGIGAAT
jgi:CubicO group peptidase (beta-lactamase class C family)